MRFRRHRGVVRAELDAGEAHLLSALAGDLLVLLGDQDDGEDEGAADEGAADPLEALVGLSSGSGARPDDPALARLLPDAYADDPDAATEFRRLTEQDLRAGKREHAGTVLAGLAPYLDSGGKVPLDRDEVDAWLGTLNDLRLVLAVRLHVDESTELDPPDDDPRAPALHLYGWLGWLQESLLSCVEPRTPSTGPRR